ncbi:DUF192 domain-containing protein [Streptomyces sp. NPDC051018]|uniref:DUF192 domain-containing protein n=1 Tax=Streptomyces sp. NPDC051018 TaxID=3365639 RepID=UPI0037B415F8
MGRRRQWRDGTGTLRVGGQGPPVPVEIAASYGTRRRGLLGRDGVDGAMLLTPCGSVHSFRMRFPLDIAYLTADLTVLAVQLLPPGRLARPRFRARHVLEAEAGAMEGWGIRAGSRLAIVSEGFEGSEQSA